jgi:hypothetical protein
LPRQHSIAITPSSNPATLNELADTRDDVLDQVGSRHVAEALEHRAVDRLHVYALRRAKPASRAASLSVFRRIPAAARRCLAAVAPIIGASQGSE